MKVESSVIVNQNVTVKNLEVMCNYCPSPGQTFREEDVEPAKK